MTARPLQPALGVAAIVVAAVAAGLFAERYAEASRADLPVFVGTLAGTGLLGLLAGWLVPRRMGALGFGTRVLLFVGLCLAIFVVNAAVAASLMFISTADLQLLAILVGYALAATALPALRLGHDLTTRLGLVERAAARVARGDLGTRVRLDGADDVARLAHTFDAMAERLEEAEAHRAAMERSRRDLFTAISHDLRTPLSSMKVMAEALSDGVVTEPEVRDRYLRTMSADIARLSVLIDDLFELARIDSGALQLRLEEIAIEEVVEAAVAGALPVAERARVAVVLEPGAGPALLFGDPQRLTRVLANLLQNAIRHTPPDGTVVVSTRLDSAEVLVTVADTGEGIPLEDLPHVFERFYRADKSRHRESGGSGLGLSISKGIVEAHGGRIWIADTGREGTTVAVALPVAAG